MSTNVCQNGPTRLPSKPNKLPPPPPLPPRDLTPSQLARRSTGAYSYAGGDGSEYGGSVYSIPLSTQSLQPRILMSPYSPHYPSSQNINCSCLSQTHDTTHSYRNQSPMSSVYLSTRSDNGPSTSHRYLARHKHETPHLAEMQKSLNIPPQYPVSQIDYPSSEGFMSNMTPSVAPRISKVRKPITPQSRPSQSISPLPNIKGNKSDFVKYHEKCKPSNYRLHVEQHIETLFKYLQEREQRRLDFEREGKTTAPNEIPKTIEILREVLVKKESAHLRAFRKRLTIADFKELQPLGQGNFGKVSLVKKVIREDKSDLKGDRTNLYAKKTLSKYQIQKQNQLAHVMAERDILAEADNDWIVKLFCSFQDNENLYFILEYIPGGDLLTLLTKKNYFDEDDARFYTAEISLALQFVHDMKFIHRDIKPDNILIDANGHIKLTDFGLCTGFRWTHDSRYYNEDNQNPNNRQYHDVDNPFREPFDGPDEDPDDCPTITRGLTQRQLEHSRRKRISSCVGSPNYIAPEVLLNQLEYNSEGVSGRLSDWWSVGVILYEMVIGYCPFIDLDLVKRRNEEQYNPALDTPDKVQHRIINFKKFLKIPGLDDPRLLLTKDPIKTETKLLIENLLCDANVRICKNGIKDLYEHPFFAGVDWVNIRMKKAPYIPQLSHAADTSHFEPQGFHTNEQGQSSGTGTSIHVNDFTYRGFWNYSSKKE